MVEKLLISLIFSENDINGLKVLISDIEKTPESLFFIESIEKSKLNPLIE